MHVIAAILLAAPRIYYGFFKRQASKGEKKVQNKIWISVKFNDDPIFFDCLNLIVLVFYIGVLFAASQFYHDCQSILSDQVLLMGWIRLELVIFFTNLLGIVVFLSLKSVLSRFRIKIQNSM